MTQQAILGNMGQFRRSPMGVRECRVRRHYFAWGRNSNYNFGDGGSTSSSVPVRIEGWTFDALTADRHSMGIRDSKLYTWGSGSYGKLGAGSTASQKQPAYISSGWARIVASYDSSHGIKDGHVYSWGRNQQGQLGLGDNDSRSVPTRALDDMIDVGCRENLSLAINAAGDLYGTGTMPNVDYGNAYQYLSGGWTAISVGDRQIACLKGDELYTWGGNASGQLGRTGTEGTPGLVSDGWTYVDVRGNTYCMGLKGSDLYTWGDNSYGQLGLGDNTQRSEPTLVSSGWTAIWTGVYHAFGIRDGQLMAWGRNDYGQLGLGDETNRNVPTALGFDSIAMGAGDQHTLAMGKINELA